MRVEAVRVLSFGRMVLNGEVWIKLPAERVSSEVYQGMRGDVSAARRKMWKSQLLGIEWVPYGNTGCMKERRGTKWNGGKMVMAMVIFAVVKLYLLTRDFDF